MAIEIKYGISMDDKYEPLNLRNKVENIFLQKEDIRYLLRTEETPCLEEVCLTTIEYLTYPDSLFPSSRKIAMKRYEEVVPKIQDLKLRGIISGNVSHLKERGTPSRKALEVTAVVAYIGISLVFPFLIKVER